MGAAPPSGRGCDEQHNSSLVWLGIYAKTYVQHMCADTSADMCIDMSVRMSARMSVHMSADMCADVSAHMSADVSADMSVHMSARPALSKATCRPSRLCVLTMHIEYISIQQVCRIGVLVVHDRRCTITVPLVHD